MEIVHTWSLGAADLVESTQGPRRGGGRRAGPTWSYEDGKDEGESGVDSVGVGRLRY